MDQAFVNMSAAPLSRRDAIRLAGLSAVSICLSRPQSVQALKPGRPSKERLISGAHDDKTPEEIEEEKERQREEKRRRLEKQRELQVSAERRKAGLEEGPANDIEMESNLRGQYYFPTARKRYLPRVKLAWDTLPAVESAARNDKWVDVAKYSSDELSDAILPMRLYASALAGGGLNISGKFIDNMNEQTLLYEKALKKLGGAVKKKQTDVALDTLTDMKGAIVKYRALGHLEAPDFGIGEIPTDLKVGSGFSNNNSALYRKNKSVREILGGGEGA